MEGYRLDSNYCTCQHKITKLNYRSFICIKSGLKSAGNQQPPAILEFNHGITDQSKEHKHTLSLLIFGCITNWLPIGQFTE